MDTNMKASEAVALAAIIAPVSQGAGTVTSGWVDMATWEQVLGIVQAGVLGASATVDAKIEQATSSGGAGAKPVTGKSITQMVKATDDGKQSLINVRGSDLDINGGFRWVRLSITVATAASLVAGLLLGLMPKNGDAADNGNATVKGIV